MIPVALSTGSLHTYGTARVFELAAEAGFDAVEVLIDQRWDTRQPSYLTRLSRATRLPIAAVHSPFVPYVPGWPHDPEGRLRESAAVARQVGAGLVVAHLPLHIWIGRLELLGSRASLRQFPLFLPARGGYRDFLLNGLAAFEAAEGVHIGVENMPIRRVLGHAVELYSLNQPDALERFPHLTLDTTHLGTKGADLLGVYERLRQRVVHVHLSDFNGEQHQRPEDGGLPLVSFLRALARNAYEGTVSLELCPEALHAEDPGRVLSHLRGALTFCRQHLSTEDQK